MSDAINPQHYKGFTGGAGRKDDRLQDLRKALYYLQREISREEGKK